MQPGELVRFLRFALETATDDDYVVVSGPHLIWGVEANSMKQGFIDFRLVSGTVLKLPLKLAKRMTEWSGGTQVKYRDYIQNYLDKHDKTTENRN